MRTREVVAMMLGVLALTIGSLYVTHKAEVRELTQAHEKALKEKNEEIYSLQWELKEAKDDVSNFHCDLCSFVCMEEK